MAGWRDAPLVQGSPAAPSGSWRDAPLVNAAPAGEQFGPPIAPGFEWPAQEEPGLLDTIMGWGDSAAGLAASGMQGLTKGAANLVGAPVDAVNMSPMLLNLLPGEQGFKPFSENPVGGSQSVYDAVTAPRDVVQEALGMDTGDFEPRNAAERFSERIGEEVGAAALPVMYGYGKALNLTTQQARKLPWLQRMFAEPMAANPVGATGREVGYSVAAGAGAQAANEAFTEDGEGTFWTDLLGSLGGVGAAGLGDLAVKGGRGLAAAVTGDPRRAGDIVGAAVADTIAANSSDVGRQAAPALAAGQRPVLDYQNLADALRRKAPVEQVIPGYTADIGTRTGDPLLRTFADDQNRRFAGAANARISANNAAVDDTVRALSPGGNPAAFGEAVAKGAQGQIDEATAAATTARTAFDKAAANLDTVMTGEARGQTVRAALDDALVKAREVERGAWGAVQGQVDPAPLAQGFDNVTQSLTQAERRVVGDMGGAISTPSSFLPGDADAAALANPVDLAEVTTLRSELTDAIRKANASGEPNRARILGKYVDAIDGYLDETPEIADALSTARQTSRDLNDRFTRRGTPIADTLATRPSGGPAVPDSNVASQFIKPDEGQASNIDRLLTETGDADSVRSALRDQIVADVRKKGLLEKPDQLDAYLGQYDAVFQRFPELRDEFGSAAALQREAAMTATTAAETTKNLSPGGASATGSFRRYDDTQVRSAMATAWKSPRPADSVRELLATAGDTPDVRKAARAALWEEVKGVGVESATDQGTDRWNARRVKDLFEDPRFSAVADELWKDDPEDLTNIREVFSTLEAATPGRTLAPGSSGTAQSLLAAPDPALTASSIASRARSVNRGQLSPTIAVVDLAATWMRRRATQGRAQFIDQLTTAAVNNPGLAADLLEKFNPADWAARRAMLTQKWGVRVGSILNAMDAGEEETDPDQALTDTIMGD